MTDINSQVLQMLERIATALERQALPAPQQAEQYYQSLLLRINSQQQQIDQLRRQNQDLDAELASAKRSARRYSF